MERSVQLLAILQLTVLGLSHIAAPKAWADFFIALRQRGASGVLVVGLLSLGSARSFVVFTGFGRESLLC